MGEASVKTTDLTLHLIIMYKFGVRSVLFAVLLELVVSINNEQIGEIQAKFVTVGEACVKDHPLTAEDIQAFKERKFPEGENAPCFSACVLRKIGFFDEKGNLSRESALEHAKKVFQDGDEIKTVEDFIDTCSKVNEESVEDDEKGCDRAKSLFGCFANNLDKFDF